MRSAVVLAFIGVLYLFSLRWRYAALLSYWWFAIFRPQDWIYVDVTSLRLPLIAAILLILPSLTQGKFPRVNNWLAVFMFLWLIFAAIASVTNGCTGDIQLGSIYDLAILIYIVLLADQLVDTRQKLFWFVALIAVSLAFHSGKGGITAILTGSLNRYDVKNLRGMFSGSNAYALASAMLLFFMIFTVQYLKLDKLYENLPKFLNTAIFQKTMKYLMLLLSFGTFYNVITLSSRGSGLAMFLSIILWIFLQKKRFKIFIILIPISIIGLTVAPIPEGYKARLSSAFNPETEMDTSAASRPHYWQTARDMASAEPLGVGPGCYQAYYDYYDSTGGYYGYERSVHSSHFQVLAEIGYVGIILWAFIFIISYSKLNKIRKLAAAQMENNEHAMFYFNLSNALVCSQTVFLIGGSFYEMAYNDITWITLGIVIITDRLQKEENSVLDKIESKL